MPLKIIVTEGGRFANALIRFWAAIVINKILDNSHIIEYTMDKEYISRLPNLINITNYHFIILCNKYLNKTIDITELQKIYNDIDYTDINDDFLNKLKQSYIYMTDYYQCSNIYKDDIFRNEIFKKMSEHNDRIPGINATIGIIMNTHPNPMPNNNEIVLHVRLDDYFDSNQVIHPKYFIDSINELLIHDNTITNIVIVVDTVRKDYEVKYIHYIKNNSPINFKLHQKKLLEDFNYIRFAKYIISSNSSFSWCATYLSNAKKIILTSNKKSPLNGRQRFEDIDLDNNKTLVKDIEYISIEELNKL
jgi:hypothetical protein